MTHPATLEDWSASLRSRRVRAKLSREELAELSGRSMQMIRAIELGHRNPSVETMALIDDVLPPVLPTDELQQVRAEIADLRARIDQIAPPAQPEGAVA